MAINLDKPHLWKNDVTASVDMYNDWFMQFAPQAFRQNRITTANKVEQALTATDNLRDISSTILKQNPGILPMLRMSTCPPIARDRLIGLAKVSKNLVENMESEPARLPPRMENIAIERDLCKIGEIIMRMADPDIFVWLNREAPASNEELARSATIVADRLCGAISDPIIRNAQEVRQLQKIEHWLLSKGYKNVTSEKLKFNTMPPASFAFRMNIPVNSGESLTVNIPVDVVIMPISGKFGDFPVLIEAKSAGDFTNVNKRRKEEAQKMSQLRATYGRNVQFGLFLCGYFDCGYLGYEAAEGIDWVWEHRISDMEQFGL